jgi:hypothetical protein
MPFNSGNAGSKRVSEVDDVFRRHLPGPTRHLAAAGSVLPPPPRLGRACCRDVAAAAFGARPRASCKCERGCGGGGGGGGGVARVSRGQRQVGGGGGGGTARRLHAPSAACGMVTASYVHAVSLLLPTGAFLTSMVAISLPAGLWHYVSKSVQYVALDPPQDLRKSITCHAHRPTRESPTGSRSLNE